MTAITQSTLPNCHSNRQLNPYQSRNCGICEKGGAEVLWPNHTSLFAHRICFLKISPLQAELINQILELFDNCQVLDKQHSHARAVTAVRAACKTCILDFLNKNGTEALKKLFITIGLRAATLKKAKL